MEKPVIYFRADGDSLSGLGHVIRSCSLAELLRDRFNCSFFIRRPTEYLKHEIAKAGCTLIEMPVYESYEEEALAWANSLTGSEIIVLDGYYFDVGYQRHIKGRSNSLVCIDDIHAYPFLADVIINHSGSAKVTDYTSKFYTQHFLGFNYCLVRKAFRIGRQTKAGNCGLLICLGGADPANDTSKAWAGAVHAGFTLIHVIVGAAYRFLEDLKASIQGSGVSTVIHQGISAQSVADVMQDCTHAVLSPSGVAIEYMSLGGAVFLYQIADNQKYLKEYLIENGLAKDFSELALLSPAEMESIVARQRKMFDNKSGERLVRIFESLAFMRQFQISPASSNELRLTFDWANEPVSRQMSFNSKPISLHEHTAWYLSKIASCSCFYYIFKSGDRAIAQVRFDEEKDHYVLSYFIDEYYRGKGLGSFVLSVGMQKLKSDLGGKAGKVVGYVKKANIASSASFEKMNFQREETSIYVDTFKYILQF